MSGWNSVETLLQDIRYGLRQLRRSPGFTAVAVLTLALGVGANTAIFSLIDAVMLRMLPVEKPEELFQVQYSDPDSGGGASTTFTNPLWEQVRDHQDVFSGAFAWSNKDTFELAEGGAGRVASGIWVSGGFLGTLGLRPVAGRLIAASDDRRGCPAVAVLSYGFWQDHYGGAKSAKGSMLSLRNHPFEVIGVAPRRFYGMEVGERFDVALPICAAAIFDGKESRLDNIDNGGFWWLNVGGRIRPNVSMRQLATRLKNLSPRIFVPENASPDERQALSKMTLAAIPAATGISALRHQFSQPLQVLMAMVGLMLLIACANLASLALARGAARHSEIAVRRALGASRSRLVRQLLTECGLLALAGALLGLLFAHWSAALLARFVSTAQNATFLDLSLDGRILGFVLAVTVLTALLFGLLPALQSTRVSLNSAIKGSFYPEAGRYLRFRGRKWIAGSQVALSLVLLVTAGLLLRSFVKLVTLNIGFDRDNVLLVVADLKTAKVPPERQLATYEEIEERLSALPGITSVGRSEMTPICDGEWVDNSVHTAWMKPSSVLKENPHFPGDGGFAGWSHNGKEYFVYKNYTSPGYLPTLRMPLLAGRNFTSADMRPSSAVAIVNETFARRFFPHLNPVGRTYLVGLPPRPVEVVGLIEDFKYYSLREEALPTAFLPVSQLPPEFGESETFELRTAIPPLALISSARAAVADVSATIPLKFHTLADQVNDSLVQDRLVALLSGFFGALALLLAMIGMYGTFNYLVTQRQTEFGIRMALGGRPGWILALVMSDLGTVLAAGLAAGIAMSLAATRLLQHTWTAPRGNLDPKAAAGLLFGLSPRDPLTMIGAAAILSAVALVAGYLPARRATRVDPIVALRHE
jgi:putative ABC transport system permease protein